LVELIEAVLLAQFPNLQRKELEQMVQTLDLRETRVFQEAMAEGIEKGKEKTREEIAVRLLNKKFNAKSVAELTGLPLRQVQQLRKTKEGEK
jgi:predicted transposase/invertase (TIGR01784 family)